MLVLSSIKSHFTLCRYQFDWLPPPPPSLDTPGLLHRNVCPAPGLLHSRKYSGAGQINDDVPGAGHLYQLVFKHEKNHQHSYLGLIINMSECPKGPGKVQKTQNAISNCLFVLGLYINPMTNVLLTDLGLSIPLKFFFESFINECVSTSVDLTVY